MYHAVIIEDEERSQVVLQKLLEKYCPDLIVVGMAGSVQAGIDTVEKYKPEVLFLDVQLTDGSGFDILEKLEYSGMAVIFTTAYDQYAIKALRFSAIDYLLKPIDIEELRNAVDRVTTSFDRTVSHQKIEHLIQNIRRDPEHDPVLLISTAETVEFIDIRDIVRCQADGAYCVVHMRDGHRYIASKLIKDFELLLEDYGFFRVHQSHLVNLKELKKYSRVDNNLILKDGTKIQLARSRKDNFFKELGKLKI